MATRLTVATGILLVKDRIEQYYKQEAQLRAGLNEYKTKRGYCAGATSCMQQVSADQRLCRDCQHDKDNPRYKRRQSEYGKIRQREREAERKEREARKSAKKKKAA